MAYKAMTDEQLLRMGSGKANVLCEKKLRWNASRPLAPVNKLRVLRILNKVRGLLEDPYYLPHFETGIKSKAWTNSQVARKTGAMNWRTRKACSPYGFGPEWSGSDKDITDMRRTTKGDILAIGGGGDDGMQPNIARDVAMAVYVKHISHRSFNGTLRVQKWAIECAIDDVLNGV